MAERGSPLGRRAWTSRGWELLAGVEARLHALERVVSETSDADWERPCEGEGWSLGLVAYHIARGFDRQTGWVEDLVRGGDPHAFSWDETNALNESIARRHPRPSRDDVLRTARNAISRLRDAVGSLGDADLARPVFTYEGKERHIDWLLVRLMPRHADGHLASIAAARGASIRQDG